MKRPRQLLQTFLLLFACLTICTLNAQDKLSVIVDQNRHNLLVQKTGGIDKRLDINYEELLVKYDSITNKEYEIGLPYTIKDDFIKGLKSPHDTDRWIFASRQHRKVPTDLYFHNRSTGQQKLLINHKDTPDPTLSFIPFAFSSNPDVIYVEAEDYIKGGYHLGIWEVNLLTKEFVKLNIPNSYMMTPLINSSRDKFYFTSTSDSEKDVIHGTTDLLMKYDLSTDKISLLKDNSRKSIIFEGFSARQLKNELLPSVIPQCQSQWSPPNFDELPAIFFRIPYATGYSYCTGRLGNIAPCDNGFTGTSCQSGTECIHGNDPVAGPCVAGPNTVKYLAVDLTSSGHTEYKIYASAQGKVTYAAWMNGYGYSVEIEHPNGLFTWYAHMKEQPDVIVDQDVCSNTIIGTEGSTGNSTGPHLHFEIRTASLCKGTEYVPFVDSGFNVLNFGDNGIVKEKAGCGPLITFVSNQDFEPNCAGTQLCHTGNNLEVSDLVVANHGDADGEPFKIKYFLVNGDIEFYLGYQQISGLISSNAALMPDVTLNTTSVPSGNYKLKVKVEANSLLTSPYPLLVEYDLSNNDCTSLGNVQIGSSSSCGSPCTNCPAQANLASNTCSSPITNGDQLTIFYEIENQGTQASGGFYVDFYAYRVGVPVSNFLNMRTYHSSINGATSRTFSKTVDRDAIMTGLADGEYFIGLNIDVYNDVAESNESDNYCITGANTTFYYTTINLTNASGPFFAEEKEVKSNSSDCADVEVVNGQLQISAAIENEGQTATGLVTFKIFVYNETHDNSYYIGSHYGILSIPANGIETFDINLDLETEMSAHGLPSGQYKVGVYVDESHSVEETNEYDNTCLSSSSFLYNAGCTIDDGYIYGNLTGNHEFNAPNYLISPNTNGECHIYNGSDISFAAGAYVDLIPGFITETGSVFTAAINDCTTVNDLMSAEQAEKLNELIIKSDLSVEVETAENSFIFEESSLLSVSPNPLLDIATIEYQIPETSLVKLALYNVQGMKVFDLLDNANKQKGLHQFSFNKPNLNSGLYILKLSYADKSVFKKIVIQ